MPQVRRGDGIFEYNSRHIWSNDLSQFLTAHWMIKLKNQGLIYSIGSKLEIDVLTNFGSGIKVYALTMEGYKSNDKG